MHTCTYCDKPSTTVDPFSGNVCCDECFAIIISGEEDAKPFKCGNDPRYSGESN